jgi:hypothetical protein
MNKDMKMKNRNKKGSILVLAVIMVVVLSIIGLAMIQLGLNARLQAIRSQLAIETRTAADAGLTKAVSIMRKKLADEYIWNNASLPSETDTPLPGSDATYSYTIAGDANSGWDIASTSNYRGVQKTVHLKLAVRSSWFGIGVKQGIDIKNSATFGTYPAPGGPLILRTNSVTSNAVTLKTGVTIPGDVVCGPGGDPAEVIDTKSNTVITGSTYAADTMMQFPSVVVPPELVALAPTTFPNSSEVLVKGDVKYGNITISGTQTLRIWNDPNTAAGDTAKIYIDGKLTLMNGAKIIVDNGAAAKLYLGGNLEDKNSASSGGGFETSANPDARNFMIFATDTCTSIVLKAKGDFYGAIYAPNANMTIDNSANLYGAYVGNMNIQIKNSGAFYFDTRLLSVFVNDAPAYLGVVKGSWWEE